MFKRIALVSMALLPLHLCLALADFIPPGTNIALKKSYSWNVEPSYKLGLDPEGDKTHLTDGVYVPGCGWTDKRTVGWDYRQAPVEITIDLGEVKPIAGISYSTAAGSACITWPVNIIVLTSDDGKEFYFAGDLTMLALHNAPVPVVGAYRYATDRLATRGRYVRLVIVALQYIFCDEIEIYRGDDGLLKGPRRDKPFTGVDAYIKEYATTLGVQKRILQDISELRQRLTASDVAADRKSSAFKALDELAILTPTVQVDDPLTFRCIFPFGDIHQRVYAQNRFLLQSAGVTNISIRTGDRWKPLSPFDIPAGGAPEINIRMMRGEYRAAVVNITNPTSNQVDIAMRFEGLPGTTAPYWIEPHEVLFMDSQYGRVLADALMPIPAQHGDRYELTLPAGMTKLFRFFGYFRDSYELRLPPGMAKYAGRYLARVELYKLALPAGMTKQVWLRFAPPARMNPGDYKGRLLINAGSVCQTVPLNIYISRLEFPVQPRLTQLWCDYTDGISYDFKALGEDSLPLAVSNLQKYFVDQTWAHAGASGMPGADYYNKKNELAKPLNFSSFDAWVDRWAGTPNYYVVFLSVKKQPFAGKEFGTQDWKTRVAAWTSAWRKHVMEKGIGPGKICVLIMDEHSTDEQAAIVLEWIKAIKSGFPEIRILSTICQVRPDESAVTELYDNIDIYVPNWSIYLRGGDPVRRFYAGHQARGAQLWTYSNAPIYSGCPYGHHRLLSWRAWEAGMTGIGFWAYCDSGGGGRGSWNPYIAVGPCYSPVYFGPGSINDGKHFEAVREGVQDYEYLAMLRDKIAGLKAAGQKDAKISEAEKLLEEGPRHVLSEYTRQNPSNIWGVENTDTSAADKTIADMLGVLED